MDKYGTDNVMGRVPVEIRRGALGKNGIPHVDDKSEDFLVR